MSICKSMEACKGTIHWYALKVFFNKVFEVEEFLNTEGVESYIPCRTVTVEKEGVKKTERRTLIPSLMFFRSTARHAENVQTALRGRVMLYTSINKERRKVPAAISDYEMNMFRFVTSSGDEGLDFFADDGTVYNVGDRVRVTEGIFKGAEGYVRRIKGKRRLVVAITGICAVATSFIPKCFLQKLVG